MTIDQNLLFALPLLAITVTALPATPQPATPITRLANLEIDPAHLDAYTAALKEEIEASIRLEPGVLTLYAVALKDNPTSIRLFETYATPAAYQSHIHSPHFLKYKSLTAPMIRSLTLHETNPILLGAHPK